MRKLPLFSAVLSLFLLVPASITRAQVTKTLNGVVKYESGMSRSTFTTPNGDVVVNLPQSMAGSVITGTVSTQPAGKNEKEKARNLKELIKMVVNLDGQKIPLTASPSNFDWLTHPDRSVRTPMGLLNVSGNKIAEVSLPPVLSSPSPMGGWGSNAGPVLGTPSKVLVKGDMLNVYSNKGFSPGEKFILTDSRGQQFTVSPITLSVNQAVLTVPPAAAIGSVTIKQEVQKNAGIAKVNLMDISLSSPNTNLKPGQQSYVQVVLNTGRTGGSEQGTVFANVDPKITERDTAEAMQIPIMSIDLRNLNPNTVTMEGGNLQRMYVTNQPKGTHGGTETTADSFSFQLTRTITGVKPGSFSVSATLHEDYNSSNDPFRPQLNTLKTPEDFNAWANALKKDLEQYATTMSRIWTFGDDGAAYVFNQNTQRAIDNMPVCRDPEQLDECKAVAYSLLQPLNISKDVPSMWLSGVEAYKAATHAIPTLISGQPHLIDWDVIKKGLYYFQQMGNKLGYDLRNRSNDAMQLIKQILDEGHTKENLEKLNNSLETLNVQANKALIEMPAAMNMLLPGGILFSTKFTPPGYTEMGVEITVLEWAKQITDGTEKDGIKIAWHFTDYVETKDVSARVNWASKDGKKSGSADFKLKFKKDASFNNCDTLPLWIPWPSGFTSAGIVKPVSKDELDPDKTKVIVFVNGSNKVGEGKLD